MGRLKGNPAKFNKIKLRTHYDADGLACAVLYKSVYGDMVDIEFTSTAYIDDSIRKWLNNPTNLTTYSQLVITDLSVTTMTAKLMEQSNLDLVLLDHHDTVEEYVRTRSWSTVKPEDSNCGATLTHQYLLELHKGNPEVQQVLHRYDDFVRAVHHYDCWLWEGLGERVPYELNQLLYILGRQRFIDRFLHDASVPRENEQWGKDETVLLALDEEKCHRYVYGRKMHYTEYTLEGVQLGVVPGDMYINDLAHDVLESHQNIDAVAVVSIGNSAISLRSRATSDVDVSKIAQRLGGGGHPNSSGVHMKDDYYIDMFNQFILNNWNNKEGN